MKNSSSKTGILKAGFVLLGVILILMLGVLVYVVLSLRPNLPELSAITDYQPKIPLRIYTADNALIGEFGTEHRDFVPIQDMPPMMKKAVLAIEDARFYEHGGLDFIGATRAVLADMTGGFHQGGSTITMQVARNFYLTKEKKIGRKLTEIALAYKIEAALSKDQILELYMNQIYLGQRSNGFSSAAKTYFGKSLKDLSIAEMAMLAGLPQNPVHANPVVNPERAKVRQHVVLKRMLDLNYISEAQYEQAKNEKLVVQSGQKMDAHADYVAEMVRQNIVNQFHDDAYTKGYKVYTTIIKAEQDVAYDAVKKNVLLYDQRHGYRGPEATIDLPEDEDARDDAIDEVLQKHTTADPLFAAVVLQASPKLLKAQLASGETVEINGDALRFAANALSANAKAELKIKPGSVIRVLQDDKKHWQISQMPEVEAAFVALDAQTGAYRALVGGFDFHRNEFNHVTSAWRQPGSSIKPFVYSAALEKGFSPSTIINDAPLVVDAKETGSQEWAPRNDDGVFDGPISMRTALAKSKNVVSVRILQAITPEYARQYLGKFGFDINKHKANLTMTLGTGSVTPLQMAAAYAVFANGGYQIQPWLIQKVTDARGTVISETKPVPPLQEDARVIDARNAYVIDNMLQEVVRTGTGAMATQKLRRSDLAGKTGTTSDALDGWFAGYAGNVVAVSWMGYDDPKSLGSREFGATLALPAWINYMHQALANKPAENRAMPDNLNIVDGDLRYTEFMNEGAVRTLDLDAPASAPTPTAASDATAH